MPLTSQNLNLTLTAFPALTSPITIAQAKTLSANVQQIQTLDNRQTLAFDAISLVYLLAHAGGTNYKTTIATLISDAQTFMGTFEPTMFVGTPGDQTDIFNAVIDWNTAYGLDTTLTANVNTILVAAGALLILPDSTLKAIVTYLNYACSIKGL
jgi:hypothetical protein